jgi:hypothetical protein
MLAAFALKSVLLGVVNQHNHSRCQQFEDITDNLSGDWRDYLQHTLQQRIIASLHNQAHQP